MHASIHLTLSISETLHHQAENPLYIVLRKPTLFALSIFFSEVRMYYQGNINISSLKGLFDQSYVPHRSMQWSIFWSLYYG